MDVEFEISKLSAMQKLGLAFREMRNKANLTQYQLAEKSKVSCGCISVLESGDSNMRLGTLNKLTEALGVELVIGFRQIK